MPQTTVLSKVNNSVTFSGESDDGQPGILCLWEQKSERTSMPHRTAVYILACKVDVTRTFSCYTLLEGPNSSIGIALNPIEGSDSLPNFSVNAQSLCASYVCMSLNVSGKCTGSGNEAGSLHSAGMDGTGPTTLITGLKHPGGITIDFTSRKLYWTADSADQIQSCDLHGRGLQTVIQLSSGAGPWGIVLLNDRIYWGNFKNKTLQSSTKDGTDIQTLCTDTHNVRLMTLVPGLDHPSSKTNHCAGQRCSKPCVLTTTSIRCVA